MSYSRARAQLKDQMRGTHSLWLKYLPDQLKAALAVVVQSQPRTSAEVALLMECYSHICAVECHYPDQKGVE